MPAVIASVVKAELGKEALSSADGKQHHTVLIELLAAELGCEPSHIEDFELQLCDVQPSTIGGVKEEFIYSGRLDNLCSVFCGLQALIDTTTGTESLKDEESVRLLAVFDHEEIGRYVISNNCTFEEEDLTALNYTQCLQHNIRTYTLSSSTSGARGTLMTDSINRITNAFSTVPNDNDVVERMTQKSYLISSDMAHGIHPNYTGKHAKNHGPKFHEGVVIKTNVNQRYATNAITSYIFKEFARLASVGGDEAKVQEFVVRQDMGCGSTIGPIVASGTGIRTIDVGCPQWSMHRYVCV